MRKIALTMTMLVLLLFGEGVSRAENNVSAHRGTEQSSSSETSIPATPAPEEHSQVEAPDTQRSNILIAYFSRTGENYGVGYIEKGNTRIVADVIAEQTGGDLFEIRTATAYPDDYNEATEVAKKEREEKARPELVDGIEDISSYDVVFIGYPIWWSDMPMAVYSFLESYDLSNKTIIPFCTHAGSGLSSTQSSISSLFPEAAVLDGLAISGSTAQNNLEETENTVAEWLQKNGIAG